MVTRGPGKRSVYDLCLVVDARYMQRDLPAPRRTTGSGGRRDDATRRGVKGEKRESGTQNFNTDARNPMSRMIPHSNSTRLISREFHPIRIVFHEGNAQ
jgi:hypothetical protein